MISLGRFTSLAVATMVATSVAYGMANAGFSARQDSLKKTDRVWSSSTEIADSFDLFDVPATVTEIRDESRQTSTIVRGTARAWLAH